MHSPFAGDISVESFAVAINFIGRRSTFLVALMASSTGGLDVPTWNGDPVEFESFATACRWFEKSLKETEKKSAASKVWARLQGPAKAVVKTPEPR